MVELLFIYFSQVMVAASSRQGNGFELCFVIIVVVRALFVFGETRSGNGIEKLAQLSVNCKDFFFLQ